LGAQALFNLGNLQRQCGEFESAVECYEGVLAQAPGHWRALLSLSVALIGLGREDAAAKALRRAFKASGAAHDLLFVECMLPSAKLEQIRV